MSELSNDLVTGDTGGRLIDDHSPELGTRMLKVFVTFVLADALAAVTRSSRRVTILFVTAEFVGILTDPGNPRFVRVVVAQ